MGNPAGGQTNLAQQQIDMLLKGLPGGNILPAAQTAFNQNLQRGVQTIQQQGPRFTAAAGQQAADLTQRSLNDFNLFSQQVLENQAARRAQEVLSSGQLAVSQGGLMAQTILPILQMALGAGGATSAAPIIQDPGFFGNVVSPIVQLGAVAAAPFTGGASMAAIPMAQSMGGQMQGSVTGSFNPPTSLGGTSGWRPNL